MFDRLQFLALNHWMSGKINSGSKKIDLLEALWCFFIIVPVIVKSNVTRYCAKMCDVRRTELFAFLFTCETENINQNFGIFHFELLFRKNLMRKIFTNETFCGIFWRREFLTQNKVFFSLKLNKKPQIWNVSQMFHFLWRFIKSC